MAVQAWEFYINSGFVRAKYPSTELSALCLPTTSCSCGKKKLSVGGKKESFNFG